MSEFKQYRRYTIAELRPVTEDECAGWIASSISVSAVDANEGSPKIGDMIARNLKNHAYQWLVAADYFAANFEAVGNKSILDDTFLNLVQKERDRQQSSEGYTAEHDDDHTDGSIADAAAYYAAASNISSVFPWSPEFLKKEQKSRKQQLIVSAALLYAEYQRLTRKEYAELASTKG